MARKDITDVQVVAACAAASAARHFFWAHDVLATLSGECVKVCFRAMERASDRGLIDWGTSIRTAWPTDAGTALLLDPANKVDTAAVYGAGETLLGGASRT